MIVIQFMYMPTRIFVTALLKIAKKLRHNLVIQSMGSGGNYIQCNAEVLKPFVRVLSNLINV